MPFIDAKISKKLSKEEKLNLKSFFGNAIALFPGKTETWLMCSIEGECSLWFQGTDDAPSAFVEVKLLGSADAAASERFTEAVCSELQSKYGIPASRVYVRYSGGSLWGWNGSNF